MIEQDNVNLERKLRLAGDHGIRIEHILTYGDTC